MAERGKTLRKPLFFVLGALLLAIVITSIAAVSSPREDADKAPSFVAAQKLAEQAEEAASQNQMGTALSLALRALEKDPENPTALRVKRTVSAEDASGDSETDAGSESGGSAPSEVESPDTYASPMNELWVLLPTGFKGWNRGEIISSNSMALVTFEPASSDSSADAVVRAVIYARDAGTSAKATQTLERIYKRAYPEDAAALSVGKVYSAYFGTDGRQLAAVGMSRGRYSFEVILTAVPGVDPRDLKQLTVELASALPAAK